VFQFLSVKLGSVANRSACTCPRVASPGNTARDPKRNGDLRWDCSIRQRKQQLRHSRLSPSRLDNSRATGWCTCRGAGPIDPATLGGPSTRSVAADDPIWQPINGISLQDYAELARDAQARGVTDEAGMVAIAQEKGWNPSDTKAALDGWVQRMGESMAVGQQFRKFLGY
jgi:hypothetical protein